MIKKEYRYFLGFLDKQQNYLNRMSHKGFRLIYIGKLSYEFDPCKPDEFQYCIEFIAQKSSKERDRYCLFLEDMGYKIFFKNINLNSSFGKIRWRPYAKGMGQLVTDPGSFNKELMIVEKKNDGKPFELHNTLSDKLNYYKSLRNIYVYLFAFICMISILSCFRVITIQSIFDISQPIITTIFIFIDLFLLIPVIVYQRQIHRYQKEAVIQE